MNTKTIIAHKDRPAYTSKSEGELNKMSEAELLERVKHLNIILGGHEAVLVEVADLQQSNKMLEASAKEQLDAQRLSGHNVDTALLQSLCDKMEKAVVDTTELSERRALLLADNHAIHAEFQIIEDLFERIEVIAAFGNMGVADGVYVHSSSAN